MQALREWRPFFPKFGEGDEDRDAFYWGTETDGFAGASRLAAIAKKTIPDVPDRQDAGTQVRGDLLVLDIARCHHSR